MPKRADAIKLKAAKKLAKTMKKEEIANEKGFQKLATKKPAEKAISSPLTLSPFPRFSLSSLSCWIVL
jgi:hypothetical protein